MNCLRVDQIYLYLEGELPSVEKEDVEKHLKRCSKCKKAVEEREFLHRACSSLHLWQTPAGFSQQVMKKIFPEKVLFPSWIRIMAGGIVSFFLAFLSLIIFSAQKFPSLLTHLYQAPLNLTQPIPSFLVKVLKVLPLILKVFVHLSTIIIESLMKLITLIKPEIQMLLIFIVLILFSIFFYRIKRKIFIGEKA